MSLSCQSTLGLPLVAIGGRRLSEITRLARELGLVGQEVSQGRAATVLREGLANRQVLKTLRAKGLEEPEFAALERFRRHGFNPTRGLPPERLREILKLASVHATPPAVRLQRPAAKDPLVPLVDRLLARVVAIATQERLFEVPPDLETLRAFLIPYVTGGRRIDESREFSTKALALVAVARMIVLEPEFDRHRKRIHMLFPQAPRHVRKVSREEVEEMIKRLVRTASVQQTSMILGSGRDIQTIRMALDRGDRVVAVDRAPEVMRDLRLEFTPGQLNPGSGDLILEQTSYSDPEFMLRYQNQVAVLYLLFPNDNSYVATAANVVMPGGLVVTVETGNGTDELTLIKTDEGPLREFRVVHQWKNATPGYETPWSRLVPTGNVISLLRRREAPPLVR